ncbi:hypothetical protein NLJ89_g5170 [Agrocybe chaxingu]|uniref:G domain-containing protein n=1 Tax=Agrocybe chaxingu TaxID=84603 RepID=A0A9W8MX45_9AGAR|nr:hypothetical protein NLJ89_g5170 [Agrocybe chaxingu]
MAVKPASQTPRHDTPDDPPRDSAVDDGREDEARPLLIRSAAIPNIIVFGETGTGKSSLVNMLAGRQAAVTSNGAKGGTFSSKPHDIILRGRQYRVWDTAGMNEGELGSVPAAAALQNLRTLVGTMTEGVNLLVYCVRGSRFRNILRYNYEVFYNIICQGEVPIVIFVTGLEHESPMHGWWDANHDEFDKYGLQFNAHACGTTTKGKDGDFAEEFEDTRKKVEEMIVENCPQVAWGGGCEQWWENIIRSMTDHQQRWNRREDERTEETSNPEPQLKEEWGTLVKTAQQCVFQVGRVFKATTSVLWSRT